MIDVCPKDFWAERKRRTVKAIYTHAVEMARLPTTAEPEQPYRLNALLVALKFQEITKNLQADDYAATIKSNLLNFLCGDSREPFRRTVAEHINLSSLSADELALVV